jgi:hypothetical protein
MNQSNTAVWQQSTLIVSNEYLSLWGETETRLNKETSLHTADPDNLNDESIIPWADHGASHQGAFISNIFITDIPAPIITITPPDFSELDADSLIMNHSYLVLINGTATEIETTSCDIFLDTESFTRTISLGIKTYEDSRLLDPRTGDKEIQVFMNGREYIFAVDSISDSIVFNSDSYRLSGRGRIIELTAEKSGVSSLVTSQPLTNNQLIDNELLSTGWTHSNTIQSWSNAAGSFAYSSLSRIQAIGRVAKASGAVIEPHKKDRTFEVKQRYQDYPWQWDVNTYDHIITTDLIRKIDVTYQPVQEVNGVFVTGINHGVSTQIILNPTQGDKNGVTFEDDLIGDTDVALLKGSSIISDSGKQSVYVIEHPLKFSGTPNADYRLTDKVRLETPTEVLSGIIIGLGENASVKSETLTLSQTVHVEVHHGK